MISVKEVSKDYKVKEEAVGFVNKILFPKYKKVTGVSKISFEIGEGELVGYIGMNGAGKSTTIKLLTGILTPTDGQIKVNGYIPNLERKELMKQIGVVFGQRNQLWWDLPVRDSFELLRDIYEIETTEYNKRMKKYVSVLNAESFIETPVRQLSLGQRMRANLIAVLLHNPKVLFLDEPTLGLDVSSRHDFLQLMKTLNQDKHITVFLTTHNIKDIEELCNRIIILNKGCIAYDGKLDGLYNESFGKYIIKFNGPDRIKGMHEKIFFDINGKKQIMCCDEKKKNHVVGQLMQSDGICDLEILENDLESFIYQ